MRVVLALCLAAIPLSAWAQPQSGTSFGIQLHDDANAAAAAAGGVSAARMWPNVVKVHKDERGYQLLIDGKPTMVLGMNWDYIPVGDNYNYNLWGKSDELIVDVLDAEMTLLKGMHVNAIRQDPRIPPRWVRYIYEKYGIYTMINHPVARWGMTIDGAFVNPVDYSNPRLRELIKEEIRVLVGRYKDIPGIAMWLLGNENNYGLVWKSSEIENLPEEQREDARAVYLYSLYREITDLIHGLDANHPVAIANGDVGFLDIIKQECPNIDVFGSNVYRGGSSRDIFDRVEKEMGVPFMYTEFGADAYDAKREREDHIAQAQYLQSLWQEIYEQSYAKGRAQNAIGGLIFQWSDGWWKYKQEANLDVHDTTASWSNEAYQSDWRKGRNNMNEEWFGICAKGRADTRGFYPVYPRAAYYMLQEAFTLDPYAPDTDLTKIRVHFGRLGPRQYAGRYEEDLTRAKVAELERIRISRLRLDLETFATRGRQLDDPNREKARFDHTESFYAGVEARPTSRTRAEVVVNALANVAANPIDEIFYENRGGEDNTQSSNSSSSSTSNTSNGNDRFQVYQASADWDSEYFRLDAFYRVGHYHWGYEGDFFGLYPEANYQPSVDLYNANAPNGMVLEGKEILDGFKVAFGPELYWGANPSIIGKYYRTLGDWKFSIVHQEDLAQQSGQNTSSAIPQPQSRRTTVYGGYTFGKLTLDLGGIMSGTRRIGDSYENASKSSGPGYLNSGYDIREDEIRFADTLGMRGQLTLNMAPFHWYAGGGYRGLVSDASPDQTMTITGWSLKESGQGNHWALSTGAAYYLGSIMLGPNILLQEPLEGPLSRDSGKPITGDAFNSSTGNYYPAVSLRNQLDDPFWVRSNRETYGFEMLLGYDPTPATFPWAWDNLDREDADFSAALDLTYRIQPTSQDAGVAVAEEGFTFAFNGAAPKKDLWEVSLRTISNATSDVRFVNWIYVGEGQANGDSSRAITRWGSRGRLTWSEIALDYHVKLDDWGPYDYHRDFNLTFPLQTMLDLSYSFTTPTWFATPYTRYGVRAKYRILDQYSNRYQPDPEHPGRDGVESEIMTYVHFAL